MRFCNFVEDAVTVLLVVYMIDSRQEYNLVD